MSNPTDSIGVRFEKETLERIEKAIEGTGQSLNAFVIECIEKALDSLDSE